MSIDRKAHARVGGATLVVLVALLLIGSRGKATAEQPTAPAAATSTPAAPPQQRINPYGDHDGLRRRGFGGGGVPPTTPAPSTSTDGGTTV